MGKWDDTVKKNTDKEANIAATAKEPWPHPNTRKKDNTDHRIDALAQRTNGSERDRNTSTHKIHDGQRNE